jgi:CRP/FNR family transcriptional regulator, cyclic AMP receptor protein
MSTPKAALESARSLLSNCVLFRGLEPAEREQIVRCAQVRAYRAGETIFTMGSAGSNMMAVLSGTIRITVPASDGKQLLLAVLRSPEVFGELAVLDGKPRSADAVAETACAIAVLERRDIMQFLEAQPSIWPKLVSVLCERLRRADEMLAEVAMMQLPARLAKALLRIVHDLSGGKPATSKLRVPFTQRDLASMVGGTRESVNKCLSAWQREQIVEISDGQLSLLNASALEQLAGLSGHS